MLTQTIDFFFYVGCFFFKTSCNCLILPAAIICYDDPFEKAVRVVIYDNGRSLLVFD
jgi:hypothetical protein